MTDGSRGDPDCVQVFERRRVGAGARLLVESDGIAAPQWPLRAGLELDALLAYSGVVTRHAHTPAPLPRSFYERPPVAVARELVGKRLCRRIGRVVKIARLVEVEAYGGLDDAASHARRGPTPRAAIMFGPPGRAYVYMIYGQHDCLNLVAHEEGVAGAILVRAAEPIAEVTSSMKGPGLLTRALAIDRRDNGVDLCDGRTIWVEDAGAATAAATTRVGVHYAGAAAGWPHRFYDPASREVSRRPAASPRPARRAGT